MTHNYDHRNDWIRLFALPLLVAFLVLMKPHVTSAQVGLIVGTTSNLTIDERQISDPRISTLIHMGCDVEVSPFDSLSDFSLRYAFQLQNKGFRAHTGEEIFQNSLLYFTSSFNVMYELGRQVGIFSGFDLAILKKQEGYDLIGFRPIDAGVVLGVNLFRSSKVQAIIGYTHGIVPILQLERRDEFGNPEGTFTGFYNRTLNLTLKMNIYDRPIRF